TTARIFAYAKELEASGRDILHLAIGQPDFKPPKVVLEATAEAVLAGNTSYTVSRGIIELRREIVNYHKNANKVNLNPKNEVIVSSGGKLSIFAALWTVLNAKDNAIVLNPSYLAYADIIQALGAEPRYLPYGADFNFNEDHLRQLIDARTKAVVINSPSNPTGEIISLRNLQLLYDICTEHDILLLSDEVYCEYLYDGNSHNSLLDISGWKDNGVVVNSLSKTFAAPGFRLGYALGSSDRIDEIHKVILLTTSCPVNFAQIAAITAYQNIELIRNTISTLMPRRHALVSKILSKLPVEYTPPSGAMYGWLKIPNLHDSFSWAKNLLKEKGVASVPGRAFGPDGEGFIRISFANAEEIIKKGLLKIGDFINSQ
ncbi:MAG: pyridoxal phosphate-dependent aminotransferase, partial [Candidatus Kariarchaeaceae archaeon]